MNTPVPNHLIHCMLISTRDWVLNAFSSCALTIKVIFFLNASVPVLSVDQFYKILPVSLKLKALLRTDRRVLVWEPCGPLYSCSETSVCLMTWRLNLFLQLLGIFFMKTLNIHQSLVSETSFFFFFLFWTRHPMFL